MSVVYLSRVGTSIRVGLAMIKFTAPNSKLSKMPLLLLNAIHIISGFSQMKWTWKHSP
jgi:hypothetical protein